MGCDVNYDHCKWYSPIGIITRLLDFINFKVYGNMYDNLIDLDEEDINNTYAVYRDDFNEDEKLIGYNHNIIFVKLVKLAINGFKPKNPVMMTLIENEIFNINDDIFLDVIDKIYSYYENNQLRYNDYDLSHYKNDKLYM